MPGESEKYLRSWETVCCAFYNATVVYRSIHTSLESLLWDFSIVVTNQTAETNHLQTHLERMCALTEVSV